MRLKSFEVASDAFELLKGLLMGHCTLAAGFIQAHYAVFVQHYNKLLQSENYVTCRESLRLLGELLLERANFCTMMKYISDRENLKVLMILLRSRKAKIQLEAFHVFKAIYPAQTKVDSRGNSLKRRCLLQIQESLTRSSLFYSTIETS